MILSPILLYPDTLFSPTYDIQICGSSDRAHKGTESRYAANEGKRKGHRGVVWANKEARCSDDFVTATGAKQCPGVQQNPAVSKILR